MAQGDAFGQSLAVLDLPGSSARAAGPNRGAVWVAIMGNAAGVLSLTAADKRSASTALQPSLGDSGPPGTAFASGRAVSRCRSLPN